MKQVILFYILVAKLLHICIINIMNRHERRKLKSKKGGRYRGLKRPTDDGVANGGKKTYG